MSLLSLPDDCFSELFSYLDNPSLYNCLFINRYLCIFSISILWKKPFNSDFYKPKASLVINTLLDFLNEDEVTSLTPYCKINFNNRPPLFEYGKFVRNINHAYCVENIIEWLSSSENDRSDRTIQKLVDVLYHIIMRQGSNLQALLFRGYRQRKNYIDLPKFSIFTTYKPGITNLESLYMDLSKADDTKLPNTFEFLSMASTYCCNIACCNLSTTYLNSNFAEKFLDIIKLQPLKIVEIRGESDKENIGQTVNSLKLRSETLRKLSFLGVDFQGIDLSFIPKLKFLEHLEFADCIGFTQLCGILSKKEFHLKQLKLTRGSGFDYHHDYNPDALNAINTMICSLVGESLCKLSLSDVTLKTIKVVKESCPNISSLHLRFSLAKLHESEIIQQICTLPSLKILNIENNHDDNAGSLAKALGDYLPISVEYLYLSFYMDILSFDYFIDNCKANLKRLLIQDGYKSMDNNMLLMVDRYQKVHNSLKVLGIDEGEYGWSWGQLRAIEFIKDKGVDVIPISKSIGLFYYCKYT